MNSLCKVYNMSIYKGYDIIDIDHIDIKINFNLGSKLFICNYLFQIIKNIYLCDFF